MQRRDNKIEYGLDHITYLSTSITVKAETYLQSHCSNGSIGNVYLSAGQHKEVNIACTALPYLGIVDTLGHSSWTWLLDVAHRTWLAGHGLLDFG